MDAAVVQRQLRLLFRVLLRDRLVVGDVADRRLQTLDDRRQKRHLPEAHLRLLDPHDVFVLQSAMASAVYVVSRLKRKRWTSRLTSVQSSAESIRACSSPAGGSAADGESRLA